MFLEKQQFLPLKVQPHLYINLGVCWPVGESLQTLAHFIICEDVEGGKGHLDQHRYYMEQTEHLSTVYYYLTGVYILHYNSRKELKFWEEYPCTAW